MEHHDSISKPEEAASDLAAFATRRLLTPAAGVMVAAAGVFSWRTMTSPPAASFDPWAYSAWGQAIARGDSPSYELASTAPKPLAAFVGALVAPLPAPRGITLVVVLAVALMIASLFAVARRDAGGAGAAVAVAAVLTGGAVQRAVWLSYMDALAAALVMLGLALRGHVRIGLWALAGLLRPEAWALAALGGFLESKGTWRRRLLVAAGAGALPPILWMVSDLVLTGDFLATLHWIEEARATTDLLGAGTAWGELPEVLWTSLAKGLAGVVTVAGCAGLIVEAWRRRRDAPRAALPLVIALIWTAGLAVQLHSGLRPQQRYLLPVQLMLALGCGLLAARVLPASLATVSGRSAAGAAVLAVAVSGATMTMSGTPRYTATWVGNARRSLPTVRAALRCGRVGITGKTVARERAMITLLAAASRQSPDRFGAASQEQRAPGERRRFAAILHIDEGSRIVPWRAPLRAPELAVLVEKAPLRFAGPACRRRTPQAGGEGSVGG